MTPEQFSRWRDFALRMARTCYADSRRPSAAWILETVEEVFFRLEDDAENIDDWDGNRRGAICVSDWMSEFLHSYEPNFYWRILDQEQERHGRSARAEDIGDEREQKAFEQWGDQFGGPIRCCVRAGRDLASAPSAGVAGFTVGDLRAMYPEGLPSWIDCEFQDHDGARVCLSTLPDTAGVLL